MTPTEMQKRFKAYALRLIRMASSFPRDPAGDVVSRQLIRCGTSAAANYRASCLGRSKKDFVNKLGIVEEETDETLFWIDLAVDANLRQALVGELLREGQELLRMVIASRKTAKSRRCRGPSDEEPPPES